MPALQDPSVFIKAQTRIKPVPHVEQIRLHLADEAVELWQKTEEELEELGLPPPFWAFAWAGGQGLARHILDNPDIVRGKDVVDFAAGSGLVGIAAMMAGARSCLAVDIDPFSLAAVRLNAEINNVEISCVCKDVTSESPPRAKVFFCGDIFYDRHMAETVLPWLDKVLSAGSRILIGDPHRNYLPTWRLELMATYQVPVVGNLEDNAIKKTSVFELLA